MRKFKKYMGHVITRSRTTTDGVKIVFGRPYPAIVDIYIIDGPVVAVGITARLTTLAECKERIRSSMGADMVSECQYAGDPHGGKWRVQVYDSSGIMWADECSPHFATKKAAMEHSRKYALTLIPK